MYNQLHKQQLLAITIVIAILIVFSLQGNPPSFILFPILLLTLIISWYLYKEIQRDQEENLKRGIRYMQEEHEAQQWLHTSFVPKTRSLAKKNMRNIIFASGSILISFIFLWTFFVGGLQIAILNTFLGIILFFSFIIYALYAPKKFTHLFKRVPKRFQHHSKNDWVHGFLLLSPIAILGFFIYSLTTTGEGIIGSLYNLLIFFFSYTLLFVCGYCLWYLYREFQQEGEQSLKKMAKKIIKEYEKENEETL